MDEKKPVRKLPSEWARLGYFVKHSRFNPKVGDDIDFYDCNGNKRAGQFMGWDWKAIT